MKRLYGFLWRKFSKFILPLFYKKYGDRLQIQDDVIFYGLPIIDLAAKSKIIFGKRVVLCSKSQYTALGVSKPIILRAMTENSTIKIGNDSGLSGTTICAMKEITIGKECLIGADVTIIDNDFHPIQFADRRFKKNGIGISPVHIQDNVFIGTKALIMKGVTIGENSVIGAGSVVTTNIPANVIAAGNPCKVIKDLKS